jgi:hypothetical protein
VPRVSTIKHGLAASLTLLIRPVRFSQQSGGVRLTISVRLEVVDGNPGLATKETDMLSSLKRYAAVAGISCAACGVGPVGIASAATSSSAPRVPVPVPLSIQSLVPGIQSPFPALGTQSPFPSPRTQSPLPGLSCSVNQGLLPGIPNLGPTGPLGPLGPHGPLGNTDKNLPCGADVFNFGPSGPLGPGGALGSLYPH